MRVLHFLILLFGFANSHEYEVPLPKFKLLNTRGFSVSIPDERGIQLFAFHGNVNKEIPYQGLGRIYGDVVRKSYGKWVYQNKTVKIEEGDVMNYWVFVLKNGKGIIGNVQSYKFKAEDFKKLSKKPNYHHKIKKRYAYHNYFPDSSMYPNEDYKFGNMYPHPFDMRPYEHIPHENYNFRKRWPYHHNSGPSKHGRFHSYGYHHHNHPCNTDFYHKDVVETTTMEDSDDVTMFTIWPKSTTTERTRITGSPSSTTTTLKTTRPAISTTTTRPATSATTKSTTTLPTTNTVPNIDIRFGEK